MLGIAGIGYSGVESNGLGIMGHVVKRAQGADGNPRDRVAEQMVTEGNSKMFTPHY